MAGNNVNSDRTQGDYKTKRLISVHLAYEGEGWSANPNIILAKYSIIENDIIYFLSKTTSITERSSHLLFHVAYIYLFRARGCCTVITY